MAVFPIRQFGDPVLRTPAAEVNHVDDSIRKLISDMRDSMRATGIGVGLAAPQIGVSRRVIVWDYQESKGALINPRITARRGEVEDLESCLSLPGLAFPVVRAEWVTAEGLDEEGRPIEVEEEDMVARILQHETDHIDGVLFIDRLTTEHQKEAKSLLIEQSMGGAARPAPAM
ncbi:MAG TPA: peptide deformylase [Actinomycetota bacterium]|nr:peptide deformylase [Actinomycetota bacterium]